VLLTLKLHRACTVSQHCRRDGVHVSEAKATAASVQHYFTRRQHAVSTVMATASTSQCTCPAQHEAAMSSSPSTAPLSTHVPPCQILAPGHICVVSRFALQVIRAQIHEYAKVSISTASSSCVERDVNSLYWYKPKMPLS
jgi:hypothetical protein